MSLSLKRTSRWAGLVPGVAVTAYVKDKITRKPIAGATVNLHWSVFPTHATTDRDGVALLQPITAERWQIEAWADSFAIGCQPLNLESGLLEDAETELLLGPGGSLEGFVRDPSGKVSPSSYQCLCRQRLSTIGLHSNGQSGHYQLKYLPRDVALQIGVSEAEYTEEDVQAKVASFKEPLNIILKPRPHGGSIAGLVVDHKNRPIAGTQLENRGKFYTHLRETVTGPNGRFLIENLYDNPYVGKEYWSAPRVSLPSTSRSKPVPRTSRLS